jgi:hypothetical protein
MPVTSAGPSFASTAGHETAAAAAAPPATAMPATGPVGHGTTRLMDRKVAFGLNAPFIPGTPPPRGETAGAHGAHKGRISIK